MSLALEAFQNERCGEMNTVLPRLTPSASSIHWLADRQRGQRYVRREALTLAQVQKRGGYPPGTGEERHRVFAEQDLRQLQHG